MRVPFIAQSYTLLLSPHTPRRYLLEMNAAFGFPDGEKDGINDLSAKIFGGVKEFVLGFEGDEAPLHHTVHHQAPTPPPHTHAQ
jgi:hypothetical protein